MNKTKWMMAMLAGAALAFAGPGAFGEETKAGAKAGAPKAGAPKAAAQKTFATPEEAAQALEDAVKAADASAVVMIVGPQSRSWIFSGDNVADAEDWKRFAAAYEEKKSLVRDGDAKAVLVIGKDDFPFAAPLVKKEGKWAFDAAAGREEVTNRRVGRNELDTMQTMLAIVDAQREYAAGDPDGNGFNDYARRFRSSEGKKDGLYWPVKAGEAQSPLGPLAAEAAKEGYGKAKGSPHPYHGYHYRMLTAQGKEAPGGAFDYLVKDKMIGGFAVLAYPAKHGVSGVMTFVVNHEGVVYEKDLGSATASVAGSMKLFNPDKTWKKSQ